MIRLLCSITLLFTSGKINFCFAQANISHLADPAQTILKPAITTFTVFGHQRSLKPDGTIHLSQQENFFSLAYTTHGVTDTAQIQYSYKLQGFDKDWVNAASREFVNYTNVPGGNYVFRLKASADGSHWFEMPMPFSIHVDTSFHDSGWFIVMMAFVILVAAGLVIYFAERIQMQRILMTQKVRNSIASDLHDDIGSSLSSIMLMSELGSKKPQQAADYFMQITENARTIIENMNDIVWAINPDNDTIGQIMVRMQSFAAGLLEKKNITLQFHVATEMETLKVGMKERRNFYLIFKETIHNAVKYAACSEVKVNIDVSGTLIMLKIEDNGKGFDSTKKHIGNGLTNLQRRAAEMRGSLQFNSAPGKGTRVLLNFITTQTGS